MDKRQIIFGGDVIPAHVASTPRIIKAKKKITSTPIPGSSREHIEEEEAWEEYDQPYSFFIGDGSVDGIQEKLNEVARVLHKKGWQVLIDEYEPDYFRLAYYKGGLDVENRYTRLGKFNLTFRCRPERYLISGSNPEAISSGDKIINPTDYESQPLIYITGSGSGTLTIQGQTIEITGMTDYLYIDSDIMDTYRQPGENRNSLMTGEYPVLKPGENNILYSGGITGATITPRFFVI